MQFSDLGLSPDILRAIADSGYTTPTPIQAQAIPVVLMGRDVLGCAQTGTGKTAGFTLPMLDILARGRAKARMPRSLILEPTRELAAQVAENFEKYGKYHKLNHALLIGGESLTDQQKRAGSRRRRADRHARPAARPVRARQDPAGRREGARDRRGRPHARHGLHPGCRAHRLAAAEDPADAVLLRHHGAGDPPPGRCLPAEPEGDHGLRRRPRPRRPVTEGMVVVDEMQTSARRCAA